MFSSITSFLSKITLFKGSNQDVLIEEPTREATGESQKKVSKFSDLDDIQTSILRKESKAKLLPGKINFFSCNQKCRAALSAGLIRLIKYLQIHGTNEELIFRREGSKPIYMELAYYIHIDSLIDYKSFSILDLASAMKAYIRDYMNGFFDKELFRKVFASLRRPKGKATSSSSYNQKDIDLLSRYILFSLSEDERMCLIELQKLIMLIDENHKTTKMAYASTVNILGLNMLPEEAFFDLQLIPGIVYFFNQFFKMDFDDLKDLVYIVD